MSAAAGAGVAVAAPSFIRNLIDQPSSSSLNTAAVLFCVVRSIVSASARVSGVMSP